MPLPSKNWTSRATASDKKMKGIQLDLFKDTECKHSMIKTHGRTHRIWLYSYKKLYVPSLEHIKKAIETWNYNNIDKWYKFAYLRKTGYLIKISKNEMFQPARRKTKSTYLE